MHNIQQGTGPILLLSHPRVQLTHAHTIRDSSTVFSGQDPGPVLWIAVLGEGQGQLSIFMPPRSILSVTGGKEYEEHFPLTPVIPWHKREGLGQISGFHTYRPSLSAALPTGSSLVCCPGEVCARFPTYCSS